MIIEAVEMKDVEDSPAALIAQFLRSNNYSKVQLPMRQSVEEKQNQDVLMTCAQTLEAFLKEADLPDSTGTKIKDDLTIEKVLQEKKVFDLSQRFEKVSVHESDKAWTVPAPSSPFIVGIVPSSNVIHVSAEQVQETSSEGERTASLLFASGADRRLHALSLQAPFKPSSLHLPTGDSPVLSVQVLRKRYVISASMSGRISMFDALTKETIDERRDHLKYVVRITSAEDSDGAWVATAGWDAKINLYRLIGNSDGTQSLKAFNDPVATLTLPTNPEAVLFVQREDLEQPMLILSRHDSTFLYYFALPDIPTGTGIPPDSPSSLRYLGRQNLAPHSNAWIAFTPSALALHPLDPSLLAVATSHTPHMKLLIVRLLMPPPGVLATASAAEIDAPPAILNLAAPANPTQASQARALLAVQDREAAAIRLQMSTLAPQSAYSTPALAWRPDGTGVWVNGDDGVVRGIEAKTGKVIAILKGGHELGSKVRCLWAGATSEDGEFVISGGFDRKIILWRVQEGY